MPRTAKRDALSQLNVRVDPELRRQLEQAAIERGVSLNREVTDRLSRSIRPFDPADAADYVLRMFYGKSLRGIAALVATAMHWAGRRSSWRDDALAYYRAREAATLVLEALAPHAKFEASDQSKERVKQLAGRTNIEGAELENAAVEYEKRRARTLAEVTAQEIIEDIALARPGHMVGSQERVDQVRADLGSLVDRLHEYAEAHPIGVSAATPGVSKE